jgi:hypothetical protein
MTAQNIRKIDNNKTRIANRIAAHFIVLPVWVNSYPHIGQTLLAASISIAHDGHSFFFILKDR